jgi:predicted RNA binding protein YcfA (HicA-like mRNA interferase family)
MSNLPAVTGADLVSTLRKIGFTIERQRGSHVFMKHPDGRATVVPVHAKETVGPGLFSKIMRDIDLSKDEFHDLIEK